MACCTTRVRERTVLFVTDPALWSMWPFLPVVRRRKGCEELGVVFDARVAGRTGHLTTVYFTNLFDLPATFAAFLALPHETYRSAEELAASGWRVD